MIERHIIIENVDPVTFYGVNNSNIQLIRNLFPKLRMAARGSVITVIGDDSETAEFEEKIHTLADYCASTTRCLKMSSSTPSRARRPSSSRWMTSSFMA